MLTKLPGPPISIGVTTTENGHIENPLASTVIMIVPSCSVPEYTALLKFTWITIGEKIFIEDCKFSTCKIYLFCDNSHAQYLKVVVYYSCNTKFL